MWTLLLSLLFLWGCQKPPASEKKTLRSNMLNDPLSFDPRRGGDVSSSTLHFALFEGLTKMTLDDPHALALAKRVAISSDKTLYSFTLRQTQWSDGAPVTAGDFAYAWRSILDPAFPSPHANLLYPIKNARAAKQGKVPLEEVGIRAPDPYTLIVELEKPTPYFLDILTFSALAPVRADLPADWADNPNLDTYVTNGPFRMKKHVPHDEIALEKNPYYRGEPPFDEVIFSLVKTDTTVLDMFEKGEIDLLTSIPLDAAKPLAKRVVQTPITATTGLFFNTKRFPFTNVHIRKAFAYAIDRKSLVENVTQLGEIPAASAIPPLLKKGGAPLLDDNTPAQAQKHLAIGLAELGIDKLPPLRFLYSKTDFYHKTAQVFQETWKKVLGVDVELENNEFMVFINRLATKEYEMAQGRWTYQFLDPINFLERYKYADERKNFTGWENTLYISLLERSSTCAAKDRPGLLNQAEAILLEELPVVPLFHSQFSYIPAKNLTGFHITPTGFLRFDHSAK